MNRWGDVKDISSRKIKKQELGVVLTFLATLIPFLNGFKKNPERQMLRDLKKIRKDFRKGRIDKEEYNILRDKILNRK